MNKSTLAIGAAAAICVVALILFLHFNKKQDTKSGQLTPPTPTPALTIAPPTNPTKIANSHTGLCLSPAGGTTNANEQIVQYVCDENIARQWRFDVVSGDVVKIINLNSKMCLTVAGGTADRQVPAVQYPCDGDPSRFWHFKAIDASTFRLINVHSQLCLAVGGGLASLNAIAVQDSCEAAPAVDWRFAS